MKKKYVLAAILVATVTSFRITTVAADTGVIEKKISGKAEELEQSIKVKNDGQEYLLKLENVVSENELTQSTKREVEEIKEVIVNTDDTNEIISKYPTLEFKDNVGNTVTLNAKEIISIEIAGENEEYWETLETLTKTITLTAQQVNTMGTDVTKLFENEKEYELTNAKFTPIEFSNNEPTLYNAEVEYTTIIPHYEKSINSYKVKIKYVGEIEEKELLGYETIANYSVEEIQSSNLPVILGSTAGLGAFIAIGWIFINNVTLYSAEKKLRTYRKGKNVIEIDVTKEAKLYENLNLVIKKRLAKRLDNTLLVIKANGNELYRTVLNAVNEDMKIIIN